MKLVGSESIWSGRTYIKIKGHPKKWKLKSRYIIEQYLDRPLLSTEIIHHKNKNPMDDRIKNLQIVTKAEHTKIHSTGRKLSDETKLKNSIAHIGKKLSIEHRKKVSNSLLGNQRALGMYHSEETKRKISKSLKGKYHSEETKRKIGDANKISHKGKILSEEHKRKIALSLMGNRRRHNWCVQERQEENHV